MIKNMIFLCIFPLILQASWNGTDESVIHSLDGVYIFSGDRHGEFIGNYVGVLDDGSEWKVHPKDLDKFSRWEVSDVVHLRVRTSFYWFKREHKFELYNHNLAESVRVMLIQYPDLPLYIAFIDLVEVDKKLVEKTCLDEFGNPVKNTYWEAEYIRHVQLSDGSFWTLSNTIKTPELESDCLQVGKYVYVGMNDSREGFWYFFILGTEREAVWIKAINNL